MSQPVLITLSVGVFLTLCSFAATWLQYRFLPKDINLNPLLEPNGMILPRPAVFLVPIVQSGFLAIIYFATAGTAASPHSRGNDLDAALIFDGAILLLCLVQLWFIRQTKHADTVVNPYRGHVLAAFASGVASGLIVWWVTSSWSMGLGGAIGLTIAMLMYYRRRRVHT